MLSYIYVRSGARRHPILRPGALAGNRQCALAAYPAGLPGRPHRLPALVPNVGTPSALSPTALTRLAGVDRRRRTAFRDCDGDLFVWCSRPTSNLVLVSGRFAVFLHAAVHYPFSRPALAALAVTVIARCLATRAHPAAAEFEDR